jgi:hypothetical protein
MLDQARSVRLSVWLGAPSLPQPLIVRSHEPPDALSAVSLQQFAALSESAAQPPQQLTRQLCADPQDDRAHAGAIACFPRAAHDARQPHSTDACLPVTESSPERSFALSRSSAADFVLTVVVSRASRSIYARIDLWLQEVRQLAGTAVAVHRTRAPWGVCLLVPADYASDAPE